MFVTQGDGLFVNELAPRPHNSYHASQRCCVTSQFEQAVRAVCDLPLGDVRIMRPAAIANLLGDLWLKRAAADPSRGHWRFPRSACTCTKNTLRGREGRWGISRRPRTRRKRRWPAFLKPEAGCKRRGTADLIECWALSRPTLNCAYRGDPQKTFHTFRPGQMDLLLWLATHVPSTTGKSLADAPKTAQG